MSRSSVPPPCAAVARSGPETAPAGQAGTRPGAPGGLWATLLLPVGPGGQPDLAKLPAQIAALARAGVDGIYAHGTAGEFHAMDEATFDAVNDILAAGARAHRLPFQIAAAHPLAPGALDRIARAARHAPDAIQVTLPDWAPIDRQVAIRFLHGAARAAGGLPLVLYNPPHARMRLSPADLAAVASAVPALCGVKCGGGDADWYRAMAPAMRQLSVMIPGHHHASGTALGAAGSYSNIACLDPAGAVAWARQCCTDPDAARRTEARIAAFMAEAIAPMIARGLPGYACDKAMAAAGFWTRIGPDLLWPHAGASADEITRIRQAAIRHLPDFLISTVEEARA